jgi:U3 small nucleolar RNA-associated protein 20
MAEPPAKRFRVSLIGACRVEWSGAHEQYATYNEKLRDISVDKGRTKGLSWEKEVYDEDTEQTVRICVSLVSYCS